MSKSRNGIFRLSPTIKNRKSLEVVKLKSMRSVDAFSTNVSNLNKRQEQKVHFGLSSIILLQNSSAMHPCGSCGCNSQQGATIVSFVSTAVSDRNSSLVSPHHTISLTWHSAALHNAADYDMHIWPWHWRSLWRGPDADWNRVGRRILRYGSNCGILRSLWSVLVQLWH